MHTSSSRGRAKRAGQAGIRGSESKGRGGRGEIVPGIKSEIDQVSGRLATRIFHVSSVITPPQQNGYLVQAEITMPFP